METDKQSINFDDLITTSKKENIVNSTKSTSDKIIGFFSVIGIFSTLLFFHYFISFLYHNHDKPFIDKKSQINEISSITYANKDSFDYLANQNILISSINNNLYYFINDTSNEQTIKKLDFKIYEENRSSTTKPLAVVTYYYKNLSNEDFKEIINRVSSQIKQTPNSINEDELTNIFIQYRPK